MGRYLGADLKPQQTPGRVILACVIWSGLCYIATYANALRPYPADRRAVQFTVCHSWYTVCHSWFPLWLDEQCSDRAA